MTTHNLSIRKRIFIGLFLVGAFMSVLFAVVVKISTDYLEYELLETTFEHEFQTIEQKKSAGKHWLPDSAHSRGFLVSGKNVPEALLHYPVGEHHSILWNDKRHHLFVVAMENDTLYLAVQIDAVEQFETQLNILIVVIAFVLMVVTLWLSFKFADIIAKPVTLLAKNVDNLKPEDTNLPSSVEDSDLLTVERAINRHLKQIQQYIQRERIFSGIVSHELRTPVTTMLSNIDTLREQIATDDTKQINRLNRLNRACLDMKYLTESLLGFIKKEKDHKEEKSPYALSGLIREIVAEHQPLKRTEQVELVFDPKKDGETKIKQEFIKIIVGNLVRNALQNTASGQVKLTLEGDLINVSDTGSGLDEHIVEWINSPDKIYNPLPHIGLGLLIIKQICDQLHISLHVTSSPGGTQFAVRL